MESDVPAQHRDGFVFHAKDLFHGGKYRKTWDRNARCATLESWLAIPRHLGIPLVLGYVRKRGERIEPHFDSLVWHGMAYALCVKAADWFMCEKTPPDEVAMVVAEERKEAREAIKQAHRVHTDGNWIEELPQWMRSVFPIKRVKAPPAFASKEDVPVLQIADAVAFVVERYVNQGTGGDSGRLVEALLGDVARPDVLDRMRSRNISYCCFSWPCDAEEDCQHCFWAPGAGVPAS